jgi:hypothetical protein
MHMRENNELEASFAKARFTTCTKSGHWLVKALHSTAFRADTLPRFLLTLRMERVKR